MESVLDLASRNFSKARLLGALALSGNLPEPLVYADVGALWGVDNTLVQTLRTQKRLRIIGFEPNRAECERLRTAHPDDLYLPFGVGHQDGEYPFHLTAFNACSSFLVPDLEALKGYPHQALFKVASIQPLPMRRFDSLIEKGVIPDPDFVKMDCQGFELHVLRGFGRHLAKVLGVRLETHLRPLYKGQALFGDIYEYMRSQGFILRDLRSAYPFLYELVELEAFFSQDPLTAGDRFQALKIWELLHAIPPGQTFSSTAGRLDWKELPL